MLLTKTQKAKETFEDNHGHNNNILRLFDDKQFFLSPQSETRRDYK